MASRSAPFLISTLVSLFLGGIIFVAVMFHGYNQRPHVSKQNPTRVNLVHIDDYYNSSHQDYNSRVDARMQRDMARVATLTQLLNFSSERSGREFSFGTPVGSGQIFGSGEYLVPVEIGNPPVIQHLVIDTGSDLPWVQCQPCEQCFSQWDPFYIPSNSVTSSVMNCSSTKCSMLGRFNTCHDHFSDDQPCTYMYRYQDGSYSKGTLLREIITIAGVWYDNTAIGCGTVNHGEYMGLVPGILGLGDGPLSYVNQQGDMYRGGFSYCLSMDVFSQTGWLEFGLGSMPPNPIWVPLQQKPIPSLPLYYVELIGLGIDNERLPIPESAFRLMENNDGGAFLDTGTVITRFPREIYEVLKGAYLEKTATFPRASSYEIMDTCYDLSIDFQVHSLVIPIVSLYFPTGVLRLGSGTLLEVDDERKTYCLAFAPHDFKFSIIGNVQQHGIQVSYDLRNRRVAFGPKNC